MLVSPGSLIIFLDYDGVLHPDNAYLTRSGPELRSEGTLFMWAPLLADIISMSKLDVRVVLSTSWVRHLGYRRAIKYLPRSIQDVVCGSTWHSQMGKDLSVREWWLNSSRYDQIARYVSRSKSYNWIAIDDDSVGWPAEARGNLIECHPMTGLSDELVIQSIKEHLVTGGGCI
ncbi:HAD domain-containing protein [Pseudomonas aeruginosa]|uniref:HAD domain-containing protein n=1 Tax=Pseudomonas aeruginosa TaxID=287 RepID=UPI0029F8E92A|nr:hypothetical protein [Pseudomonas aeruginosa]MCG7087039.1 hypothetical protein [Pseudomonas aeruginosa]MCG7092802.1 hypothetical protein [Pseudomonas aeruginosa]MCG7098860.1 hypothetical protein [Pseudomonas aeruginosa]MCG7105516.1 hypothetical protein [Pseudomonas aeruginosa]